MSRKTAADIIIAAGTSPRIRPRDGVDGLALLEELDAIPGIYRTLAELSGKENEANRQKRLLQFQRAIRQAVAILTSTKPADQWVATQILPRVRYSAQSGRPNTIAIVETIKAISAAAERAVKECQPLDLDLPSEKRSLMGELRDLFVENFVDQRGNRAKAGKSVDSPFVRFASACLNYMGGEKPKLPKDPTDNQRKEYDRECAEWKRRAVFRVLADAPATIARRPRPISASGMGSALGAASPSSPVSVAGRVIFGSVAPLSIAARTSTPG